MSEERTSNLKGDSTNPLPIEELVTRHFNVLMTRFDQVGTQLNARIDQAETQLNTRIDQVETQLNARIGQVETKVDGLGRDVRSLKLDTEGIKEHLFKLEERLRDYDDKVDAFIRESLFLKRQLREFQDSLQPKN